MKRFCRWEIFALPSENHSFPTSFIFLYSWKGTVRAVLFYCIRESASRNTALPFFLKRQTRLTGHFISIHYDNGFHPLYCFASAFRSRIPNHENKHLIQNLSQNGYVKSPRWAFFSRGLFIFDFIFRCLRICNLCLRQPSVHPHQRLLWTE